MTSMRVNQLMKLILVLGSVFAACPVCTGARLLAEWSAVQDTGPGRRVRVALYEDRALGGPLKFDGSFASATPDSVTLALRDGSTRTFDRPAVRRVSRRRPIHKRTEAWVIAGLTATVVGILQHLAIMDLHFGDDLASNKVLRSMAIWSGPAWGLTAMSSSQALIYNVPLKHRSP